MSGRSLDNLKQMVNIDGITYAACEGLEILHPDGSRFMHPVPNDHRTKLQALFLALKVYSFPSATWLGCRGSSSSSSNNNSIISASSSSSSDSIISGSSSSSSSSSSRF